MFVYVITVLLHGYICQNLHKLKYRGVNTTGSFKCKVKVLKQTDLRSQVGSTNCSSDVNIKLISIHQITKINANKIHETAGQAKDWNSATEMNYSPNFM